jgi:hypothetical protein
MTVTEVSRKPRRLRTAATGYEVLPAVGAMEAFSIGLRLGPIGGFMSSTPSTGATAMTTPIAVSNAIESRAASEPNARKFEAYGYSFLRASRAEPAAPHAAPPGLVQHVADRRAQAQ